MRTDTYLPRLPARYLAQLLDLMEAEGIARGTLMRAARIRAIDTPGAQVTLRQVEALFAAAEQASGRLDLGFELGRRLDPTSHDLLGYAMLTSPTLGHLLRLAVSYQRLIQPFFALSLKRSARHAELVYVPAVSVSHRGLRVLEEAIVVSNHTAFESTLGKRIPAYDVSMSIARPPHAARYREIAPARVQFGDPVLGLRIALPASVLDMPLAMANPRAMRDAEERCRAQLDLTRSRRRWSEWCGMMLREAEDSRPTLEQLAGIMNVSPRTLARYLQADGTSFRDLALDMRTQRARQMLAEGSLSVTQVAYRLGYTDVASFVRSFRAQTGRTPGSLRTRATPGD
ncbi:MAG TPA: AraC family transcriptional regulator [Rudaea sp.]|nr:AraC family transcriptional regulator [Rudaea sp.]